MSKPTKAEVLQELDAQIQSWRESYTIGKKGRGTDPEALRAMECLREAKRLINNNRKETQHAPPKEKARASGNRKAGPGLPSRRKRRTT